MSCCCPLRIDKNSIKTSHLLCMVILSSILYIIFRLVSVCVGQCWTMYWKRQYSAKHIHNSARCENNLFLFTYMYIVPTYVKFLLLYFQSRVIGHTTFGIQIRASVYLRNWIVYIVRCLPQYEATQSCDDWRSGLANKSIARNCWHLSNMCIVFVKEFLFRAEWLPLHGWNVLIRWKTL